MYGEVGWLGGWIGCAEKMFAARGVVGDLCKIFVDVLCSLEVMRFGCSSTCFGTCSGHLAMCIA